MVLVRKRKNIFCFQEESRIVFTAFVVLISVWDDLNIVRFPTKKSYGGPWLKCLLFQEAQLVIRELYEGHCDAHLSGRMLLQIIMRQCYY